MKYFTSLLLLFSSCDADSEKDLIYPECKKSFVQSGWISKIEYENHSYIYCEFGRGVSLVHDPDCKCEKEHKK